MFNSTTRRLFGARPQPEHAPSDTAAATIAPPPTSEDTASPPAPLPAPMASSPQTTPSTELAAHLAARLCHDIISPAGAITSGLDLLEDPHAADMRDEAMSLIQSSARKLVELLAFCRVAFGASAAAETFDTRTLETLTQGVYAHVRPELVWSVDVDRVNKAAARAILNMAQLAASALPTGGAATVSVSLEAGQVVVRVEARSNRVRLRPEVVSGLNGERLASGLSGQWVQAFYLSALVTEAGGVLEHRTTEDLVVFTARLPA